MNDAALACEPGNFSVIGLDPGPDDRTAARTSNDSGRRWEARLFGTFRLTRPDGSDATPRGRKARALVAYLLATSEAGATRERLAGLLWSERGDDQARASLRQTVYALRTLTTGDDALIAPDRLGIRTVGSRVSTDLAPSHAFAEEPLHAFLVDLDGIDPAFDDWLSIERMRRADERRRALLATAERGLATGDVEAARRWADHLLRYDAADETAARLAMRASHAGGDRVTVQRIRARLEHVLHRQVGVGLSNETIAVHQQLMAQPMPPRLARVVDAKADTGHRAMAANESYVAVARTLPGSVGGTTPVPRAGRSPAMTVAICACAILSIGIGLVTR